MKYMYTAVISCDTTGKYIATVPDISGCITTGNDLSDAIQQITDALSACLLVYEDEDIPAPAPCSQEELSHASGDYLTLIQVDTISYRARTDTKCVRRNVSIPAWLNHLADKRGVNCSRVLQEALTQMFS